MNIEPRKTPFGYAIDVQPLTGWVKAVRNGTVIAASTRAKAMYETRLPPTIYFPPEDVIAQLGEKSDLQTFCPFKGNGQLPRSSGAGDAGGECRLDV